jgi:hypothetical protein
MKEEDTAENGVEGRVERASSKGSDGQGDEAGGEETLKCPMVRTVGGVGLGNGSRVVDCECVSVIQKISCEASQAAMRLLSKSFHTSTLNAFYKLLSVIVHIFWNDDTYEVREGEWQIVE